MSCCACGTTFALQHYWRRCAGLAFPYLLQLVLELGDLVRLHEDAALVEVLDDVVVVLLVNGDDDGLDGGVAFDKNTCRETNEERGKG